MSTVVEIQLNWKYTPKSCLEEPIQIKDNGFDLLISNGIALAKVDPVFYADNPQIKKTLTDLIEDRLIAVQIMSHADFTLSEPTHCELKNDGKKHYILNIHSTIQCQTMTSDIDIVVQDKDGNIISDPKRDRLDKQKWFAEIVGKHRDSDTTLNRMLKSYSMAVKDPQNELVHLYEIRDALSTHFDNKKSTIKKLDMTNEAWGTIGKLANSQPLKEGRHRGKSAKNIRPAEKNELKEARGAAFHLIEKYLIYLETLKYNFSK